MPSHSPYMIILQLLKQEQQITHNKIGIPHSMSSDKMAPNQEPQLMIMILAYDYSRLRSVKLDNKVVQPPLFDHFPGTF